MSNLDELKWKLKLGEDAVEFAKKTKVPQYKILKVEENNERLAEEIEFLESEQSAAVMQEAWSEC